MPPRMAKISLKQSLVGLLGGLVISGSVVGVQAGDIPSDLQAEAEKIQAQYFTQCGDDMYAQFPSRPVEATPYDWKTRQFKEPKKSIVFRQYKNLRMAIRVDDISPADQLNGIVWRGHVGFSASLEREFNEFSSSFLLHQYPQGWAEWKDSGNLLIGVSLVNKRGHITPLYPPQLAITPSAPSCASVPLQHDMKEEQK